MRTRYLILMVLMSVIVVLVSGFRQKDVFECGLSPAGACGALKSVNFVNERVKLSAHCAKLKVTESKSIFYEDGSYELQPTQTPTQNCILDWTPEF